MKHLALVVVAAVLLQGCRGERPPLHVGIVFNTAWKLSGQTLAASEQAAIKQTMIRTLNEAFHNFDVRFVEGTAGERLIRVEDTPYSRSFYLGAVGVTNPVATESSVRFDALYYAALAVAGCEQVESCRTRTRAELLEGMGRGLGATAAHELGHQRGFHFAQHSRCNECYDGGTSTSYAHFFGRKRWSERAQAAMRRVLPVTMSRAYSLSTDHDDHRRDR